MVADHHGQEPTLYERLQEEVEEIAEVLMREHPGATMAEVWEEPLSLHRVRYERIPLPRKPRSEAGPG